MLCTYYRPRSLEAEAFRSLRTALYFSALGEGCKVIQITSPNAQEGKSTLAANLAVSIAQSGKRVVLVDADLRTPQVHKMLGLAASAGLASVLAGAAEPNDAVLPSSIPGLSVLACGPVPPNPAELLTSPAFKDLLDLLRDRSDFVIVDTPPLLAVTDASVVASRVDGVLLTLRLSRSSQPAAAGAAQALAAVGAPLLGVIVNATDRRAGPAGYHQGHYLDQGAGRYTVAVSANGTDPDRGADGPASGNTQNGSH
jgi:succinoglycan biosynthesis transport protein ExoP